MAVRLECAVKNYHWGKVGSDSKVAQFAKAGADEFTIEEDNKYAELWMGTLATGPAVVKPDGVLLSDYISKNPSCLGETILDRFQERLPFLFKVLSVNISLSIQAHPNKKHAEELNKKFPDIYKDSNHKPEMALALTDFEGMCGFRPFSELQTFVQGVEELAAVIGERSVETILSVDVNDIEAVKAAIKQAFDALMRRDSKVVIAQVTALVFRLQTEGGDSGCIDDSLKELLIRLNNQFAGDCGVFCAFFLNHMKLKPGDAMFLAANLPHAYLSGDCIECMATSDNVVRAGLTPKFKDVDTLVAMLDYTPKSKEENLMSHSVGDDSHVRVFKPPVPDFAVHDIQVEAGISYSLSSVKSASIVIVTEGEGELSNVGQVKPGHVLFVPANESCSLKTTSAMVMYRALCLPQ